MVTDIAVVGRTPGADEATAPGRQPIRRHRWWAVALVCAVCVTLVGASALVAGNEVRTDIRFDQAHRSLDAARRRIALAGADLTTVRSQLDTVDGQVEQDAAVLSQDTSQLRGLESALTSARSDVSNQTSAIGDLNSCLAGVEQALNALSVGDQTYAIDALDAVSTTCTRAMAVDG